MHKVDFIFEAEPDKPFKDVKVGQKLDLAQQEDGTWSCNREDGSVVCPVPAAAAGSIAHCQRDGAVATAVIRSVKRCQDKPGVAASIQIRINFATQGSAPRLQQAPAPADDPTGFSLTTTELEQLAYNDEIRKTLGDKRLQDVLLKVDGAANREQALQQAMDNPDFRDFADKMLHVMKPTQYPSL